jgi:hypothetical protein
MARVYDVVLYSKDDAKKHVAKTCATLREAKRWVARFDADEFVIERRVV